ncbi:carboxymuconolactone decarboxylase family protein [Caulobacter hibisci]|uniref:Alkyl hydroperoxide reductase AhpD n=1 Tax=Caulobacter hibisci TaxID=2035993 RepID=A0ABS0SUV5_9CAUL|nr:carboxymuconolactone decarboxylase family protein [Caulobacter hibisci]MBI1683427.1 carboxymuconolactone decarboxylase family protein [Caulobacter hibisci]
MPPLDALASTLPAYARDVATNLRVLSEETVLGEAARWGCFVACAHAVGPAALVRAASAAALEAGVSAETIAAVKAAAATMAMNNVYHRAIHLMDNAEYRALPSRLRINVTRNPGAPRVDFELWSLAVSAINGCGACLDAHEEELRALGVTALQVQAALRIAAVVHAAGRVLAAEAV